MAIVQTRPAAWIANALTLGVLVTLAAPDAIFVSEAWAGAFIGLSACAFALSRRSLAVGLGVGAVFVRELATPYCVVCTLLAARQRRWGEVSAWAVGALAYAVYYTWHVKQVLAERTAADLAHGASWLAMPGVPFLQATLLEARLVRASADVAEQHRAGAARRWPHRSRDAAPHPRRQRGVRRILPHRRLPVQRLLGLRGSTCVGHHVRLRRRRDRRRRAHATSLPRIRRSVRLTTRYRFFGTGRAPAPAGTASSRC